MDLEKNLGEISKLDSEVKDLQKKLEVTTKSLQETKNQKSEIQAKLDVATKNLEEHKSQKSSEIKELQKKKSKIPTKL